MEYDSEIVEVEPIVQVYAGVTLDSESQLLVLLTH